MPMNSVIKPAAFHKPGAAKEEGFISNRLAAFAAEFDLGKVPGAVIERAKLNILDCLGIGFASTTYEFGQRTARSEEHTSELQSLMRISYAVFCFKKNN